MNVPARRPRRARRLGLPRRDARQCDRGREPAELAARSSSSIRTRRSTPPAKPSACRTASWATARSATSISAADASCRKASSLIDAAIASGDVRDERDAARGARARRRERRNAAPDGAALRRTSAQLDRAPLRADRRRGRGERRRSPFTAFSTVATRRRAPRRATSRCSSRSSRRRWAQRRDRQRLPAASTRWIATGAGSARSARTTCWPAASAQHRSRRRARRRCARHTRAARTTSSSRRRSSAQARPIADGDAFIFFNFRPDRARQLTTAFDAGTTQYYHDPFDAFAAKTYRRPYFATMTKYDENYTNPVLFGPRPQYETFGEIVAARDCVSCVSPRPRSTRTSPISLTAGREEPFARRGARTDSVGSFGCDLRSRAGDARARDHRRGARRDRERHATT